MNTIEKLFSLIMIADLKEQNRMISLVDEQWMLTNFHKDVYSAINECLSANEQVDLVSVNSRLRKMKSFKNEYTSKLSDICINASYVDKMHYDKFVEDCHREFVTRRMSALALRLNEKANNISTLSDFTNMLENAVKEIAFKQTINESNIDIANNVLKRHEQAREGNISGLELPYLEFKRVVLLEPVDLMVIGARPAMGKTAFVVSTAVKMAFNGYRVLIFALEMSKEQMMRRILSNLAEVDSNRIKYGEMNNQELERVNVVKFDERLNNIILVEGTQNINTIARSVSINKPDIVLVDYLQKVKGTGKEDLYTSVTKVSNGLKEICQNMHVPIIAMAQLSRPDASRVGKRPSLPDLRQSGEIEQDASIVGFLHRPEYYGDEILEDGSNANGVCEIIIAKNREGEIGVYPLSVDLKTSNFKKRENISTFEKIDVDDIF